MNTASHAASDVSELLESWANRLGDKPFLRWVPFEGPVATWTYGQFRDRVASLAAALAARGVAPGDRVLLNSENCPEFLLTWFACAWLGAVCVVANPRSVGPELGDFARRTRAVGAVSQARSVAHLAAHCQGLRWVVLIGDDALAHEAPGDRHPWPVEPFDRLRGPAARHIRHDAARPIGMMFTSGTTSRPKAVVWTRANAAWAAQSGVANLGLAPDDVALVCLPLYHVVGLAWSVLPALHAGATVVLQPRFSASRFWPAAQTHRATFASHVQFSIGVMARQPAPPAHHFRRWASSTWLPEHEAYFKVPILGWWGMTETVAPGIVGHRGLTQQPGTIGWAAPGYAVRIVDEHGHPVADGLSGELWLRGRRGESLFAEYLDDPGATAEAFAEGDWLRTGDRVKRHEDGSIQFIERSRDVIKTGGEGVSPAEVERVIRSVDGVRMAALVARPDPAYGEVGVAFVVTDEGLANRGALVERVMQTCQAELAPFKVPREVRLLPELPLAGLNKVAKGELRRLALMPSDEVPSFDR